VRPVPTIRRRAVQLPSPRYNPAFGKGIWEIGVGVTETVIDGVQLVGPNHSEGHSKTDAAIRVLEAMRAFAQLGGAIEKDDKGGVGASGAQFVGATLDLGVQAAFAAAGGTGSPWFLSLGAVLKLGGDCVRLGCYIRPGD
jgi:hypothetical protein